MNSCDGCGCTKSQAMADAKTLGIEQEFQSGVYTCCQIADWAEEQWSAWAQATREDADYLDEGSTSAELDSEEAVLVPIRFRRPVPWFRRA
jgi:hypothetical protein